MAKKLRGVVPQFVSEDENGKSEILIGDTS
jgi:hypothetical protein